MARPSWRNKKVVAVVIVAFCLAGVWLAFTVASTWLSVTLTRSQPVSAGTSFYAESDLSNFLKGHQKELASRGLPNIIKTNMYDLAVDWYSLSDLNLSGGALSVQRDLLLVVDPAGRLYWVNLRSKQG